MKRIAILIFCTLLMASCSKGPSPIDYGNEACSFCKMTIVDVRFGAELISETGKVHKYDGIECMVRHQKELKSGPKARYYMISYTEPGDFISRDSAVILRSQAIPSPMGAFLSAYRSQEDAITVLSEREGEFVTWDELVDEL